jgi:hypothetical protein
MVSDLEMSIETLDSPWYAGQNAWHPPYWLKHESNLVTKYMHSFFWGAGMVTSLVPRDIEPSTTLESIITTSTMFFGLLLNAYIISSLTQVGVERLPPKRPHEAPVARRISHSSSLTPHLSLRMSARHCLACL